MKSIGRHKSTNAQRNDDRFINQTSSDFLEQPVLAKKSTARPAQGAETSRVKATKRAYVGSQTASTLGVPSNSGPSNSQRSVSFNQTSPDNHAHRGRTPALKIAATPHLEGASRRLSVITPTATTLADLPRKTNQSIAPYWQTSDDAWNRRRPSNDDEGTALGRNIKIVRRARGAGQSNRTPNRSQTISLQSITKTPRVVVGTGLSFRKEGNSDASGSGSPMDEDGQERSLPPRIHRLKQMGKKAARKREWPPTLPSSPSESESPTSSSDTEEDHNSLFSEEDEDEDEAHPNASEDDNSDVVFTGMAFRRRSPDAPEITFLRSPPKTIKTLAESPPPDFLRNQTTLAIAVSEDLVRALLPVTLPITRMRQMKRLPFLPRILRRGFLHRCEQMSIPAKPSENPISFEIHFEFLSLDFEEQVHKATVNNWVCCLCDLHKPFDTKDLLDCHLEWDHPEITTEWDKSDTGVQALRIILKDVFIGDESPFNPERETSQTLDRSSTPQPKFLTEAAASPLPFVALSPPTRRPSIVPDSQEEIILSARPPPKTPQIATVKPRRQESLTPTASLSRGSLLSNRSRSITVATTGTATTATASTRTSTTATSTTTPGPRLPSRYPTPPPAHNRLGPAAQPPYLPFKSEYDGPDLQYSCRPGGPCIYDLLNTLPLQPYGVLAWDILDREDEIFDSDNVKDEYKVMHALWGRWIVLNRNIFVADYYKGTIAFVDFYWKMIHRAAGWDGLRYWLLMLSVNRFLSGHEIAQILKHYEGLVGMDYWD